MTWRKKLGSYVVVCVIIALTDVIGLAPEAVESIVNVTQIYLPSQAIVDGVAIWKGNKKD